MSRNPGECRPLFGWAVKLDLIMIIPCCRSSEGNPVTIGRQTRCFPLGTMPLPLSWDAWDDGSWVARSRRWRQSHPISRRSTRLRVTTLYVEPFIGGENRPGARAWRGRPSVTPASRQTSRPDWWRQSASSQQSSTSSGGNVTDTSKAVKIAIIDACVVRHE